MYSDRKKRKMGNNDSQDTFTKESKLSFNIPLNISKGSNIGLFNELDTETNYSGNALVEYFMLKLIHKHYKSTACVSNLRVFFNVSITNSDNKYTVIDYDFNPVKISVLNETIRACKNDMFVLYAYIKYKDPLKNSDVGHSVVCIINKKSNTLEYYDPHGINLADNSGRHKNTILRHLVVQEKLEHFVSALGLSLSMDALYCPLQNNSIRPRNVTEDKGYCMIFTSIFVLFRLSNSGMNALDFSIEFFKYTFDIDTNEYARYFSFYLLKEVRRFANHFEIKSDNMHEIYIQFIKLHSLNNIVKSINQTGGNPLLLLRASRLAPKLKGVQKLNKTSKADTRTLSKMTPTELLTGLDTTSKILSIIYDKEKARK